MKTILFIAMILLTTQVLATQKVVLLTSLAVSPKDLNELTEQFLRSLPAEKFETEIVHRVAPDILLQYLRDETIDSVVWVSHSAAERALSEGVKGSETIIDVFGNNVVNFFSSPHKKLKFLAVVGCEAKKILEGFDSNGLYREHENFRYFSFDKKVKLQKGLKLALRELQNTERTFERINRSIEYINGTMNFRIDVSQLKGSGWLEIGQRVVGFIDPKSSTMYNFELERAYFDSLKNKNFRFFFDQRNDSHQLLGTLKIGPRSSQAWEIFADRSGVPLGGRKQLYVYRNLE